nr:PhM00073.1 [Neoporphyra haitanensis]
MSTGPVAWPVANATAAALLGPGVVVDSVGRNYLWVVIVGGVLAFGMAWGIGANDVANAFATSVGAGSLSLQWACAIAAVMEFAGALLMGSQVTDTVRRGIIKVELFDPLRGGAANGPDILLVGFLAALCSSTAWLILATYFGLPVSTTHSIVGSLVGVGMAYGGPSAVIWLNPTRSGLGRLKNSMVGVVASWLISPLLSAVFAVAIFLMVRTLVLRRANPFRNGLLFLPFFYAVTVAITIFFIIYKGSPQLRLDEKFSVVQAVGIALGGGGVMAVLSWWIFIPQAKRFVDRWEAETLAAAGVSKAAAAADAAGVDDGAGVAGVALKAAAAADAAAAGGATAGGGGGVTAGLGRVGLHVDMAAEQAALQEDADVRAMHDRVEKFDPKAERLFMWLQIFTAAFDSFAHGANDVANSIGPFSSIYQLYHHRGQLSTFMSDDFEEGGVFSGGRRDGTPFAAGSPMVDGASFCGSDAAGVDYYACRPAAAVAFPAVVPVHPDATTEVFDLYDATGVLATPNVTCASRCNVANYAAYASVKQEVPLWILAMGGAGIVLGLAMWGYRIIVAIGMKLTKLTPSRGFAIEVGAAVTVILASRVGLPVSTTHCQVGSTIGVGVVELKRGTVNWKQFAGIFAGWVFTVIATGSVAAAVFSFAVFSPSKFASPQDVSACPGDQLFAYDQAAGVFNGIACSGASVS